MTQNPGIKNDLVNWFVRNITAPNIMRVDTPGFVTVRQNYRGEIINQRNVFFSEMQLAGFESALVEEFGEEGKKIAYSIGKNFGYAYCHCFSVPQLGIDDEGKIKDFISFFSAFMGVTWGEFLDLKYDLKAKAVELGLGDHIVCRRNGLGYMFSSGDIAGGWQYIMRDDTVEGVQTECIGRGDKCCKVICAPAGYIEQKGHQAISVAARAQFEVDSTYLEMNRPRPLQYSKASIKELIAANFFKFENNQLTFHDDRYCFTGIELLYILEQFAKDDERIGRILFKTAFDQGEGMAKEEKSNDCSTFITDILSAIGFGDTLISRAGGDFQVQTNYFPYLATYGKIDYFYFRGLLSGLLSGFSGKKTELKNFRTDVSNGYLKLELY